MPVLFVLRLFIGLINVMLVIIILALNEQLF